MTAIPPLRHTGVSASAATDTRQYIHYSDEAGVVKEIKIVDDKVVASGQYRIPGVKYFSSLATFHWLNPDSLTQLVFSLDASNDVHAHTALSDGFSDEIVGLTAAEYSDIAAGYVRADGKYKSYLYVQVPNGDILELHRLHPDTHWGPTGEVIKDATKGTGLAFVYRDTKRESRLALVYENKSHQLAVWTRVVKRLLDGEKGTPISHIKPVAHTGLAAVRTTSNDRLYYLDEKNEIIEYRWTLGKPGAQIGLGTFALPGSKIDAVVYGKEGDDNIRLFFQNADGALCRKIYTGGRWSYPDVLVS